MHAKRNAMMHYRFFRNLGHNTLLRSGFMLILLIPAMQQVRGQGAVLHTYSARFIRPQGVNPVKPMLADVQQWLPDAEVTVEREEDIIHISMEADLDPADLGEHLEQFGIVLASFTRDGIATDQRLPQARELPWLAGVDNAAALTPGQVTELKSTWVAAHPAEYQQFLHPTAQ